MLLQVNQILHVSFANPNPSFTSNLTPMAVNAPLNFVLLPQVKTARDIISLESKSKKGAQHDATMSSSDV